MLTSGIAKQDGLLVLRVLTTCCSQWRHARAQAAGGRQRHHRVVAAGRHPRVDDHRRQAGDRHQHRILVRAHTRGRRDHRDDVTRRGERASRRRMTAVALLVARVKTVKFNEVFTSMGGKILIPRSG